MLKKEIPEEVFQQMGGFEKVYKQIRAVDRVKTGVAIGAGIATVGGGISLLFKPVRDLISDLFGEPDINP
jgi:hypothetical protein